MSPTSIAPPEKLTVPQLVKNLPPHYSSEDSSPDSLETCPKPGRNESNEYTNTDPQTLTDTRVHAHVLHDYLNPLAPNR